MARNVLRFPGLQQRGIRYTRPHLRRLEIIAEFPTRILLGPNSVGWVEDEIDAWVEVRIAARDGRLTEFMAQRKAERGTIEPWLINIAKKLGWAAGDATTETVAA